MSLDNTPTRPCPNCGSPIPGGASLCPNCGWEAERSGVWPPTIAHADVSGKPRKRVFMPVLQIIGGLVVGVAVVFGGLFYGISTGGPLVVVIGVMSGVGIFLGLRKPAPFFAYSVLTGTLIAGSGIGACIYSFSHGW